MGREYLTGAGSGPEAWHARRARRGNHPPHLGLLWPEKQSQIFFSPFKGCLLLLLLLLLQLNFFYVFKKL